MIFMTFGPGQTIKLRWVLLELLELYVKKTRNLARLSTDRNRAHQSFYVPLSREVVAMFSCAQRTTIGIGEGWRFETAKEMERFENL